MNKIFLLLLSCYIALLSWGCENDNLEGDGWSVIYPDGPDALVKGVTYNILWKAPSSSSLRIELYQNSKYYTTIAEESFNTGGYEWIISHEEWVETLGISMK